MEGAERADVKMPQISQADLECFHAAHFSTTSTDHFAEYFLGPVETECVEEAYDNDLGYYNDGVKRTLTDEQIAIFRHSEIQSLLRARRNGQYTGHAVSKPLVSEIEAAVVEVAEGNLEDGELEENNITLKTSTPPHGDRKRPLSKKQKKALKAKNKGVFKQNIKPDLRKRTWDKVEQGVGSLAYDDEGARAQSGSGPASQRRCISYDD